MKETVAEILSLSSEPAVIVQQRRIVYANAGARRILGEDCVGSLADTRLRLEGVSVGTSACLADTVIDGVNYILRVNRLEEGRLIFLNRQPGSPPLLNDAFLCTLRSRLMALGVAADSMRPIMEDLGEARLLNTLAGLTRGYYQLMRLTENAGLAQSLLNRESAPLCASEMDLSLLCHAALDAAELYFPALTLEREIPSSLSAVVDARLLRQLLFNLLSNAIQHGYARTVRFTLRAQPESIVLSVSDDGKGIAEEELSGVFFRYLGKSTLSEAGGGVGLGLSAARAVTQLHGGTLLLESRPQSGTTVRASISRHLERCGFEGAGVLCDMHELQVGLADCLPEYAFHENVSD